MSVIFGVQILMNKYIRNNIILKTEQNSSQAHHIKCQNQNLEDNADSDEAAHYEPTHQDLQCLQNQLLFYLVLKCLITCIRVYLLES